MVQVAEWPDKYGCDGIDLDLEEGAGARYSKDTDMEAKSNSLVFWCKAVHVTISFLASFLLICLLFLFISTPKVGWDVKK